MFGECGDVDEAGTAIETPSKTRRLKPRLGCARVSRTIKSVRPMHIWRSASAKRLSNYVRRGRSCSRLVSASNACLLFVSALIISIAMLAARRGWLTDVINMQ